MATNVFYPKEVAFQQLQNWSWGPFLAQFRIVDSLIFVRSTSIFVLRTWSYKSFPGHYGRCQTFYSSGESHLRNKKIHLYKNLPPPFVVCICVVLLCGQCRKWRKMFCFMEYAYLQYRQYEQIPEPITHECMTQQFLFIIFF